MDNSEKIRGKKIFDILEYLKSSHTILNIHVMGTDFEGLTIILGVSDGEKPSFFIDYPGGANSLVPLSIGKKCYFEFNDEGKIKHSFKTTIHSIFGKRIKFNFPEVIERSQRRKTFRILVPSGSRLLYSNNKDQYEFDVVNVSEGGLLVSLKAIHHNDRILIKGNKLSDLVLSSKQKDLSVKIKINAAEIIRLEKLDDSDRINYGLKLIEVDKSEEDKLKRFIYYCQRKILKKRGGLES